MLVTELRKIQQEIDKMVGRKKIGPQAHAVLQVGNSGIAQKLSEAIRQLEEWKCQLDARNKLQRLLENRLLDEEYMRVMWWQEQAHFYESLCSEVQAYFTEHNSGRLSTSLTAMELLLLVRLCIEEGILRADSLQSIFEFLATHMGTAKYANLSYESLKKRYSLRHDGARKKVRQALVNLIRRMDEK